MSACVDCQNGEHLPSECPAFLPCPLWPDQRHCFANAFRGGSNALYFDRPPHMWNVKWCKCGVLVRLP